MIDASIYQQIKPIQTPDVGESLGKMMTIRGMADQNQANQMKLAAEKKSAYTKEAIAEFEYLNSLPPEQQAVAYPKSMMKLGQIGMPTDNLIKDQQGNPVFDQQFFKQQNMGLQQTPEYRALMKEKLDNQKTVAEINSLNKKASGEYDPYKMLMMQSLQDKMEQSRFDKTPEGRIRKLGGEETKRLDNIRMGLTATQGMADALASGSNTFSVIGDNDFTIQSNQLEEAIGRMQSGGAIGVEEAKKFLAMRPKAKDSKEIQIKKLNLLSNELGARLKTMGFKNEDVGLSEFKNSYQEKYKNASPFGSGSGSASAASMPVVGTQKDGYVFVGGDPAKETSWSKAK